MRNHRPLPDGRYTASPPMPSLLPTSSLPREASSTVRPTIAQPLHSTRPGDTFLDMSTWGKGMVWVNGHAMGRFWKIGPQQTLFMPGCWLKKGKNEIVVLDLLGPEETKIAGLKQPILDVLHNEEPVTHRKEGETLNLKGETPVATGELKPGGGWQTIQFNRPVEGRYFCRKARRSRRQRSCCHRRTLSDRRKRQRHLPPEMEHHVCRQRKLSMVKQHGRQDLRPSGIDNLVYGLRN